MLERKNAIYARQSLDKKDSLSIESQITECKKRAGEDVYEFIDRKSGKNVEREELQKLLKAIENKQVKDLYVYKLDRLSRSIRDFYNIYAILQKNDVGFYSISENSLETKTTAGKTMMGILAVFAEMERENIKLRVKDNYIYRTTKKGSWPGGPAPYGFINGVNNQREKTLLVNEKEIKGVAFAFQRYNEIGATLGSVAKELKEHGFDSKRKFFDSTFVARLLHNPVYVKADKALYYYFKSRNANIYNEISEWDGTKSAHIIEKRSAETRQRKKIDDSLIYLTNFEGIIDSNLYIQAQEKMSENKQIKNSGTGKMGWIGGLCKCGRCGGALKNYNSNSTLIACYKRYNNHSCDAKYSKHVNIDLIKELATISIQNELDVWHIYSEKIKESNNNIEKEIEKKENKIRLLTKRMIDDIENDIVLNELNNEINKIQNEINLIKMKMEQNIEIKNQHVEFEKEDEETKKNIARTMINKIIVDESGSISIEWKHKQEINIHEKVYEESLMEVESR